MYKFSDHQPYFTCLDLTSHHVKPPRVINICKQNKENILSFKNDLLSVNLLDNLDLNPLANPNDNYNELDNIIQTVKNKHFPRKTIKYNKYKHKKSEWITKGIMKSIKFRNNLYRQIRSTSPLDPVIKTYRTNLRNYNKIIRQSIKNAKKNYYTKCFSNIKSDMKRTWRNINSVLNKTKVKKQFPDKFKLDAQLLTDKFEIANQFNTFFVNIGTKHTENIVTPPNKSYKDYLTSPCETSFNFTLVTENDINNIISKLNSV